MKVVAKMGGTLQQPRVDVKDIAGKRFATGWAAQQQRKLAISAGMVGQIVVNDENVPARFHEVLRDTGRGVGGDVGEPGRVVAFGHDDDGVIHRAFFAKVGDDLGDGGRTLADRAIDAQHILVALVQNGVDRDGGLAGLPVAEDQFTLAAADRNQRIDDDDAGLQRHGDESAVHDRPGGALDGQTLAGGNRPFAIEWARPIGSMTRPISPSPTGTSITRPVRSTSSPACRCSHSPRSTTPISSESTLNAMPYRSPGNFTSSSKPTPGRPETLAMPVETLVIVPTSRGVSCGVNASNVRLIPANA